MDNQKKHKIWDLVVGEINNSLDKKEQTEFEKIKDSDETKATLKLVKQLQSKAFSAFSSQKIDKGKQWQHIRSSMNASNPVRKLIINISKYAAVFVIALFIGILLPKMFLHEQQLANNVIEIEWGHMSKMTLSDGTQVWLNAGTTFEYPSTFNSKKRLVSLNGEAQFKVAHNEKNPFEVETSSGIVKVYGTTFNISSYEDDPEMAVTLIEGSVGVESVNGKLLATLEPSEQILVNKKTGKSQIKNVDTEFYSSWIEGKILLEKTKLSELSKILQRWYNVDITIQGEGTGDIEISGTILKGKPLDLFLKVLDGLYGVKSELKINKNAKDELLIYKN